MIPNILTIRNFRSIIDKDIEFNRSIIICGNNGAGKSSILKAIEFALYGGHKSNINNRFNYCSVQLDFLHDGYNFNINRSYNKNKFIFNATIDSHEIKSEKNASEVEEVFRNKFKMSLDLFKVLSPDQGNHDWLIYSKPQCIRQFFIDFFSLQDWFNYQESVSRKIQVSEKELDNKLYELKFYDKSLRKKELLLKLSQLNVPYLSYNILMKYRAKAQQNSSIDKKDIDDLLAMVNKFPNCNIKSNDSCLPCGVELRPSCHLYQHSESAGKKQELLSQVQNLLKLSINKHQVSPSKILEEHNITDSNFDEVSCIVRGIDELGPVSDIPAFDTNPIKDRIQKLSSLKQAYKEIPILIINQLLIQVEGVMNELLQNFDFCCRILFESGINPKFQLLLIHDGHERVYDTLSGGEKFQVQTCFRYAICKVKFGNKIPFFSIDEGFGSQHRSKDKLWEHVLRTMEDSIDRFVIITHENRLHNLMFYSIDL